MNNEQKQTIEPYELWQQIQNIHHRKQDIEEGNIEERLYLHPSYTRVYIPIAHLLPIEFDVDDYLVDEYTEKPTATMPPIVCWFHCGNIGLIDGTHRVKAAKKKQETHIWAYIGNGNADWETYEQNQQ